MQTITNEWHGHTDTQLIDMYSYEDQSVDMWITNRATELGTHLVLPVDTAIKVIEGLVICTGTSVTSVEHSVQP